MREFLSKVNSILRGQRRGLALLLLCMAVNAAFELLGIGAVYPVMDLALNPGAEGGGAYARLGALLGLSGRRQLLLAITALTVLLFALKTAFLLFFRWLQLDFQYRSQGAISRRLLAAYMAQPYSFFARSNSATLIQNVYSNVANFLLLVFQLLQIVVHGFTALCIGAAMLAAAPLMASALLAVACLLAALYFLAVRGRLLRYGNEYRRHSAAMLQWLNQSIGGIKETKVLGREAFFVEAYGRAQGRYAASLERSQVLGSAPNDVLLSACICTVLVSLALMLLRGEDVASMVTGLSMFALAAFRIFPCISTISSCLNQAVFYTQSVDALHGVIAEAGRLGAAAPQASPGGTAAPRERLPFASAIELRGVSFRYEGAARPVFRRLDLEVPRGSSVALVGPSGAGKTTAADILLGLLDPTGGAVLVDGADIRGNRAGWLANLGYIPQSIYLSDDTVRGNIAFGLPPGEVDDGMVWAAAEQAQLAGFIRSLPGGLDTCIGERGVRMSGGQRQRVGIARALYNDPEVLVLDEATSALDSETEAAVMESIDRLAGRKTLVIIAHRLSTIRNCDRVYEIRDGAAKRVR